MDRWREEVSVYIDVIWTLEFLDGLLVSISAFGLFPSAVSTSFYRMKQVQENSINFKQQVLMETKAAPSLTERPYQGDMYARVAKALTAWRVTKDLKNWSYLVLNIVVSGLTSSSQVRLLIGQRYSEEQTQEPALNMWSVQTLWCSMLCRTPGTLSLIPPTACSEPQLTWEQPEPRNGGNNVTCLIECDAACSTVPLRDHTMVFACVRHIAVLESRVLSSCSFYTFHCRKQWHFISGVLQWLVVFLHIPLL